MNPILSICIPTYNRADSLKKTLDSILLQLQSEMIEIIVSDNASADGTKALVEDLRRQYSCIKYYRNEKNIGLDANTLAAISHASGEYCWLCSDDDIPLPGSIKKIFSVIDRYSPQLIYLNYAGFIENEDYRVVYTRNKDQEDVMYQDGEKMLSDHLLNHFSAIIAKRSLLLKYFYIVDEYLKAGFVRGYSINMTHYIILENKGLFIYVGKLCLAVRNLYESDYNPATSIIDAAKHYQILRQKRFIREETEKRIIRIFIRRSYKGILSTKCFNTFWLNEGYERIIIELSKKYDPFYFYIYPFYLYLLPSWLLKRPYYAGRKIKSIIRSIFNLSPFN